MLRWEWRGKIKGRDSTFALGESAAILESGRHGLNEWGRFLELKVPAHFAREKPELDSGDNGKNRFYLGTIAVGGK